jgi:hypothetical protein
MKGNQSEISDVEAKGSDIQLMDRNKEQNGVRP